AVTSTTGIFYLNETEAGNNTGSSFAQLWAAEGNGVKSYSQELRALTSFDSPINFMAGAFYQGSDVGYTQYVKLSDTGNFNPANGKYIAWVRPSYTHDKTLSGFAQ